ncbi:hypothetical protein LCGC14_0144560 [marine sediment metagenome]
MRFYMTGQRSFANRGCEAIVRSTVAILARNFGHVEFLVPSDDIALDKMQWPEAGEYGVRFVESYFPAWTRPWAHIQRIPLKAIKTAGWPFSFPAALRAQIEGVDAVISVGGDNYSLDYRLPSLLMGIDQLAMKMDKPVIIWGASVGPFDSDPKFLPAIRRHLAQMTLIAVRESISFEYLTGKMGLTNVVLMADPAFTLEKQAFDVADYWPMAQNGDVIGFNISPLIERYRSDKQNLRAEAETFIRMAVSKGYGVLLVPHVMPLRGDDVNDDATYMNGMLASLNDLGSSVTALPRESNASQLKHAISKVRYFIGARTHATIAALSSAVPTVSIAYSVKAIGINKDLLGDMPVVLPTPELSADALMAKLSYLIENKNEIVGALDKKLPLWRDSVEKAADELKARVLKDA